MAIAIGIGVNFFGKNPKQLWTPSQLATSLWLDANDASTITLNGTNVSQWNDKSGNNNHVAQGTASSQPIYDDAYKINNIKCPYFSASESAHDGDFLENTTLTSLNAPFSIFCVSHLLSLIGGSWRVMIAGIGSTRSTLFVNSVDAKPSFSRGGTAISASAISTPYTGLYGAEATTSTSDLLYVNGAVAANADAGSNPLTNSTGINIGTNVLNTAAWDGYIGEVIIISAILSNDDRQKIEGYLAHKWGLTANLPAGHPYKEVAP